MRHSHTWGQTERVACFVFSSGLQAITLEVQDETGSAVQDVAADGVHNRPRGGTVTDCTIAGSREGIG